jgi:hypothetical protein
MLRMPPGKLTRDLQTACPHLQPYTRSPLYPLEVGRPKGHEIRPRYTGANENFVPVALDRAARHRKRGRPRAGS